MHLIKRNWKNMKVSNIRVEYLSNPIGIDITHPTLNWNVDGEDIKFQKAFEIIYRINNGEEKSIKKESSSTHYEFEQELKSRDFVTFKVRVQNELGKWSNYCDEQHFSIGLLNKSDWTAKWIYGDYPVSKNQRYPVDCFKKTFTVKDLSKATLYMLHKYLKR